MYVVIQHHVVFQHPRNVLSVGSSVGHVFYPQAPEGPIDGAAKLDLSKLCEFCIKSCLERRKMTAVN